MDSIGESGIITPILVRPKENGLYEVISGHRRWEACKELGVLQIPAKVLYLDDDEATVLMVNSNIQREHVLPSEKAFAYKMRMEAMNHQGKSTSSQVGTKLRTLDEMGKELNESRNQIHRFIRLTYLIPSILKMVDEGRMARKRDCDSGRKRRKMHLISGVTLDQFGEELVRKGISEDDLKDILDEAIKSAENRLIEKKDGLLPTFSIR